MAKCGNCNIDMPSDRALVAHMVIVHNSTFSDDDAHKRYLTIQDEILKHPDIEKVRSIMHGGI